MTATWMDLFAGGGGSSEGLAQVPGVEVAYAMNHWQAAVETHAANHPDTHHDCVDLSTVHPGRYPRTDFGWFSPSCTHHSRAWGKARDAAPTPERVGTWSELVDLEADETRATMLEVIRFAEHHDYDGMVVENVPEIQDWRLFGHWLAMLKTLGYSYRPLLVNSGHANHYGPAVAQSRLRYYGVFWKGSRAPEYPAFDGPMLAADTFLDPDPGRLLHERPRPLAAATMARVDATLDRYPDAERMVVSYYGASVVGKPTSEPVGTLTTRDRHAIITRTPDGIGYRMLNVAEQTRLGGFPDSYVWTSTAKDTTKMIGNAVSPCAARDIARPLVEAVGA